MTGIPLIDVAGPPAEAGRRHGVARGAALRGFLADRLGRVNALLPEPVTVDGLRPLLDDYRSVIADAVPDLAAEIDGLADGAGITRDEALFLQLRREILGYRRVPAAGDCTTFARARGRAVLAQTVDLNGDVGDQLAVLRVERPGSGRRALVFSVAGLLGYLGVNSDGLAIGLNLVLGGDWHPGVPPYLAIRHLLDHAGGVEEALALLEGLPLASSRCLVLCDRTTSAYVEICGDTRRVVRDPSGVAHTNHFLHPDLRPHDALNVFARTSSVRRLDAADAALAVLPDDVTAADCLAPLTVPPVLVPDVGDIRLERTVAVVVLFPDDGTVHVRPGGPDPAPVAVHALEKG